MIGVKSLDSCLAALVNRPSRIQRSAPDLLSLPSPLPPTMAVLPSPETDTESPCPALPTASVPTNFGPCCENCARAGWEESSLAQTRTISGTRWRIFTGNPPALMPFGNPRLESQRDSDSKPRVARHELPWETWAKSNNPNGVAARRWKGDTTPLGLKTPRALTPGSSCLTTLGWKTQSLWDCRTAGRLNWDSISRC